MSAQPRRPATPLAPSIAAAFSALFIAAAGLVGCARPGPAPATESVANDAGLKIYRHGLEEAPSSLDPVQAANIYASFVVENAYDTLFSYKYLARPYQLKPNLADGWPEISPDLLTYTIRLKKGVLYQDDLCFPGGKGREVVAGDVVYSIKRNFDPANRPQGGYYWQGRIVGIDDWKEAGSDYSKEIPGLRALDSHTLQVTLTRPYPQLLDSFAQAYAAVVPREAVKKYGREFAIHPVGSGPFQLVSYDSARVVMDRNRKFRQEPVDLQAEGYDRATQRFAGVERIQGRSPPFIDRLILDFISSDATSWNSFTKGNEIQFVGLAPEKTDEVIESKSPLTLRPEFAAKYQAFSAVEPGFVSEVFNFNFPDFGYNPDPVRNRRNKALRCAIMKAWDWKARNDSWYFGLGVVFPGVIPPAVPEFDPDTPKDSITRDVAGARQLLRDNGWTAENLPELIYGNTTGVKYRMFYEQFRAWLGDIGYPPEKVKQKTYATFGAISRAFKENELPIVAKGWYLDYPDAENTLQLYYGPNKSPGSNDANYQNPEYDRLYEQASVMLPSPERTAIYRHMNRLLLDDCVGMTGISRTRIMLWHKNVVAFPDRAIAGGFFFRYVDVLPEGESARPPDLEPAT
jgi:oligopeptide transport system substrate-binding protein